MLDIYCTIVSYVIIRDYRGLLRYGFILLSQAREINLVGGLSPSGKKRKEKKIKFLFYIVFFRNINLRIYNFVCVLILCSRYIAILIVAY